MELRSVIPNRVTKPTSVLTEIHAGKESGDDIANQCKGQVGEGEHQVTQATKSDIQHQGKSSTPGHQRVNNQVLPGLCIGLRFTREFQVVAAV